MKTELWETDEKGKRRMINEITPTSKYVGFKLPKWVTENQHTAENQEYIAKILRDGWQNCYPHRKYEIISCV